MSVFTIIFRKAVSAILFVVNIFKKVLGLFWRKKESNIGELPFIAPTAVISQGHHHQLHDGQQHSYHSHGGHGLSPPHQSAQQNSWNSWNDTTFGVESKIEEYRKKQSEALQRQKSKDKNSSSSATSATASAPTSAEPDYFNDLRPEIKPQKRVQIDKERTTTPIPRKNLFEFKENEINIPLVS
uniref:Uncharacterized protein n=1 Tax=Panagrolaimus sp. PS1159 TaxID=55785 RepID=A0AC35FPL5_9BILA